MLLTQQVPEELLCRDSVPIPPSLEWNNLTIKLNCQHVPSGGTPVLVEFLTDASNVKFFDSDDDHIVNVTILPAVTSTQVVSSKNPSISGNSVDFAVTVTSQTPVTPMGSVTFTIKNGSTGTFFLNHQSTQPVNQSSTSITQKFSSPGQYSITVTYNPPDNDFAGSTATLVQTVQ
jgi:hypothetical protein